MSKNQEYIQQYAEYAMQCQRIKNISNNMQSMPCYVENNITWQMLSIKLCNLYYSYY